MTTLTLHELADQLAAITAGTTQTLDPVDLDQIAGAITHHHQQSGGPIRQALAQLLSPTTTNQPHDFAEAATIFATAVDLYAHPPPGQLSLFDPDNS